MDLADVAHAQSLATLNPFPQKPATIRWIDPDVAVNVEKPSTAKR